MEEDDIDCDLAEWPKSPASEGQYKELRPTAVLTHRTVLHSYLAAKRCYDFQGLKDSLHGALLSPRLRSQEPRGEERYKLFGPALREGDGSTRSPSNNSPSHAARRSASHGGLTPRREEEERPRGFIWSHGPFGPGNSRGSSVAAHRSSSKQSDGLGEPVAGPRPSIATPRGRAEHADHADSDVDFHLGGLFSKESTTFSVGSAVKGPKPSCADHGPKGSGPISINAAIAALHRGPATGQDFDFGEPVTGPRPSMAAGGHA